MLTQRTITEFLEELGSAQPTPGGGAAVALVGALSCALAEMDARLTYNKQAYAAFHDECKRIVTKSQELRVLLIDIMHADEQAYLSVSQAMHLPRTTEMQRIARLEQLEQTLNGACVPPFQVLELCLDIVTLHKDLIQHGNTLALSDAAVGLELALAAARSSFLNVLVNTKMMQDTDRAQALNNQAYEYVCSVTRITEDVYEHTTSKLGFCKDNS